MDIFWVLLFISFPVFYMYGIVSFVRDLMRRRGSKVVPTPASVTVAQLEIPRPPAEYSGKDHFVDTDRVTFKDSTVGWYSENSISLLLYVGAFLIVASAAAFVGLAWENIGGVGKALVMTLVCLGFFGAGMAALTNPRIKQAAYTFLGIGTLLIPFVSWGWYGFVLREIGFSAGLVWFLSSVLTLTVSILLAQYVQQRWYAYVSSLAVLSGMLSMVYMKGLSDTFYILSSVLSAFLYFGASVYAQHVGGKTDVLFAEPYRISAQILMPLSLAYGIFVAADRSLLFSFEAVLVAALGSIYYLMTYLVMKTPGYFTVAQSLFLVTLLLFSRWVGIETEGSFTLLLVCGAAYVVQAPLFKKREMQAEGYYSQWLGMLAVATIWLMGMMADYVFGYQVFYSGVLITVAMYCGWMEKQWLYGWIVGGVTAYLIQYVMNEALDVDYASMWYGLIYAVIGLGLWIWGIFEEQKIQNVSDNKNKIFTIFGLTAVYYLLGTVWLSDWNNIVWVVLWIAALMFMVHAYVKQFAGLVYAGVVVFLIGALPLLSELNVSTQEYPFVFSGIAFGLYCLMMVTRGMVFERPLRYAALLLQGAVPILFSTTSNALITAYVAVILFAIDAFLRQDERSGYAASAYAMLAYVWQLMRWDVDTLQFYTLAIGLYFLALGYYREYKTKNSKPQNENAKTDNVWLFYYLGMGTIIIPTFFQMWDADGIMYAALMLLYGFGLFSFGITKEHRPFKNAGIAAMVLAVLSQVYGVVAALDWYLVLGVFGLVMLGLAVWLANNKK